MNLWQRLFVNLHTSPEVRKIWRERFSNDCGKNNNRVYLIKDGHRRECSGIVEGLAIRIEGHDNCIEIHEPCHFSESDIWITGNNNRVEFGQHARLTHLSVRMPDSNRLFSWGAYSSCEQVRCFVQLKDLIIGTDCMLSDMIEIMANDGHTLLEKGTLKVLNYITGKMTIGDHVWIGRRAFLTKNACIPNDCIVGADALVTKAFTEESCAIAGSPARVVKQGVTWNGAPTFVYMEEAKKEANTK